MLAFYGLEKIPTMNSQTLPFCSSKQRASINISRVINTEKATKKYSSAILVIRSQQHSPVPQGNKISNSINDVERKRERRHQRKCETSNKNFRCWSPLLLLIFPLSLLPERHLWHSVPAQKADTQKPHGLHSAPRQQEKAFFLLPKEISLL